MAKQTINLGSGTNTSDGDTIRDGGGKINANFTELYDALGITAADMGTFTGTTLTDNTTAVALFQELETALEALSPTVQGQFAGAAATFAALPTVINGSAETVDNGDWALLTAVDGVNNPGLYVYDGSAWVFGSPLDFTSFSAFTGADGTNPGAEGLVPAPAATDNLKFLRGDGTFQEVQTDTLIADWAATTDYVENQIVRNGALLLRSLNDNTSNATFNIGEAINWQVIAQSVPTVWAPSTIIIEGEQVVHLNSLYACTTTFTSAADFSLGNLASVLEGAELKEWTGDTRYELGTVVLYAGMLIRRTAEVPGGSVSEATFDDTEANRWAVIGQSSPYPDWAATTQYIPGQRVRVDGTTYSRNTGQGGTSGADFASEAANWTSEGVSTLDALQDVDTTTVAPTTGNFLVFDGTNWAPSSSSIIAALLDSSGAVLDTPLPAATGNGAVALFANDSVQTNTSTISVAAGESLNGTVDGVFITSNYDDGTQFIATDVGAGEWVVAVQGAATSDDLVYVYARQTTVADLPAADDANGVLVFDDASIVMDDPSGFFDGANPSRFTFPKDGRYSVRVGININDGGTDVDDWQLRLNGVTTLVSTAMFEDTSGNRANPVLYYIGDFAAGDYVETIDPDAVSIASLIGSVNVAIQQHPKTEVVLAGMVEVQPLANGRLFQTVAQTYNTTAGAGRDGEFTVEFDSGSGALITADTATDSFTVTQAGRYTMTGAVRTDTGSFNATYSAKIAINGVSVASGANVTTASNANVRANPQVSATRDLVVGDVVTLVIQCVGTTSDRDTDPDGGVGVYLEIDQLPSGQVANPGDVPVEDLHHASIGSQSASPSYSHTSGNAVEFSGDLIVDPNSLISGNTFVAQQDGRYYVHGSFATDVIASASSDTSIRVNGTVVARDRGNNDGGDRHNIDISHVVDLVAGDVVDFVHARTLTIYERRFEITQLASKNITVTQVNPQFTEAKTLHHAKFYLDATTGTSVVVPYNQTLYNTSSSNIALQPDGSFILQPGRWRIDASANLDSGNLDLEIFDSTNNAVLGQHYSTDQASVSGIVDLTAAATIQVREVDGNFAATWFSDNEGNRPEVLIQQLPTLEVVTPGDVPVEDLNIFSARQIDGAVSLASLGGAGTTTYSTAPVIDLNLFGSLKNTGGMLDGANGQLVIPVDGTYTLSGEIAVNDNGGSNTRFTFYIGDTTTATYASAFSVDSGFQQLIPFTYTRDFVAGERLDIRVGSENTEACTLRAGGVTLKQLTTKTITAVDPAFTEATALATDFVELSANQNFPGVYADVLTLTAPQDGRYRIHAKVCASYDVGAGPNTARLAVDGAAVSGTEITCGDTDVNAGNWQGTHSTEKVVTLTAGQVISLQAEGSSSGANIIYSDTQGNTSLAFEQLPTLEMVTPGDVPVEDVEVELFSVFDADFSTANFAFDIGIAWNALIAAGYSRVRFDVWSSETNPGNDTPAGSLTVDCRAFMVPSGVFNFDVPLNTSASGIRVDSSDTSGSAGTAFESTVGTITAGESNLVITGIKAQKTVLNTTDEDRTYSATEVNTNRTWVDGKPIYRLVVSLAGAGTNQLLQTGVDTVVNVEGYWQINPSAFGPLPFADGTNFSSVFVSSGEADWQANGSNLPTTQPANAYCVIEYTKA